MAKRSKVTIDHDEIRQWAEARGGQPAVVKGTNIIRLDFPGYSGEGRLVALPWEEWFDKFDESNLALVIEDKTARGQKSYFNKLIGRETVNLETGALERASRRRAKQGARSVGDARRVRAGQKAGGTSRRAGARKRRAAKPPATRSRAQAASTAKRKSSPRSIAAARAEAGRRGGKATAAQRRGRTAASSRGGAKTTGARRGGAAQSRKSSSGTRRRTAR